MGQRFDTWRSRSEGIIAEKHEDIGRLIRANRDFHAVDTLSYGDHGLHSVIRTVLEAIRGGKRIALYADYDVDGTMSAVSWIWFFRSIAYTNFVHYIPCRFREGYGVNFDAIRHLIEQEHAELIITMDTGITANVEAAYCRARGVEFICTDHHKIQTDKMPDCQILNPKLHPDPQYQELCGCGITFVLLRKLAEHLTVPADVWTDILALVGMATICDVVPLNGVNHRLAKLGVQALMRSKRRVLVKLREAAAIENDGDEKDIGFRIGPRINAVGRLEHADMIIEAFISEDPSRLIVKMGECNDRRKTIQQRIVKAATDGAKLAAQDPILFLGDADWHPGVVGIAASKICETFWRPTWLFQRGPTMCKGSARSIEGFDVTDAMSSASTLFTKFGGHRAAGGFSFDPQLEGEIHQQLKTYGAKLREEFPELWRSVAHFDCELPVELLNLELADVLDELKPFGHGFVEPRFRVRVPVAGITHYRDKQTQEKKHTAVFVEGLPNQKLMFFNEVLPEDLPTEVDALVTIGRSRFRGQTRLELYGVDWSPL